MARTGRPASKNPLKYDIKVRLDEETFQKLNAVCEQTGTERATFIRESVRMKLGLGGMPAVPARSEDAAQSGQAAGAVQPGLASGETKRLGPPQKSVIIKGGKDGVTRLAGEAKDVTPAAKRQTAGDAAAEPSAESSAKAPQKGKPVNKKIDVFLL